MNKEELEQKFEDDAKPLLLKLALVIAKHPLRWSAAWFVIGAFAGVSVGRLL